MILRSGLLPIKLRLSLSQKQCSKNGKKYNFGNSFFVWEYLGATQNEPAGMEWSKKINNGWLLILRSVPIGTKNIYYYTIFLFLEHCGKWWHFFCLFCRVWPSNHKTDIWRLLFYTLKMKYLQKLVKFFIPFYCWKKNASRPIVLNHYLHKLLWCLPLCSI